MLFSCTASALADDSSAEDPASVHGGKLQPAGAFPHEQRGYVVAALPNGKVLAHGHDDRGMRSDGRRRTWLLRDFDARLRNALSGRGDYMWNPARRGWKKVDPPPECRHRRYLHTLTALPDGRILAAGGLCDEPRMRDDEKRPYAPHTRLSLWNGTTEAWESAPKLSTARIFHTASLRPDGSVLIAGGESDPLLAGADAEPVLDSVELYQAGRVEALPALRVARAKHAAVALDDGSVLVAGGIDRDGNPIEAAERWNPVTATWTTVAPMIQARFDHSATLLDDGRVMVAGGVGAHGVPIASVEIWNPLRDEWDIAPPLLKPVKEHAAARMTDGAVLIAGGTTLGEEPVREAMRWDEAAFRWVAAGLRLPGDSLSHQPPTAAVVPLKNGRAQVFTHGAIYHWVANEKSKPASYYRPRAGHTVTVTTGGRILIAGGRSDGTLVDWAEVFDPETQRFTPVGRMAQPRAAHAALALPRGAVVVAGGLVAHADAPDRRAESHPEVWDPGSNAWRSLTEIRFAANERVHMGLRRDGTVLFVASREAADDEAELPGAYRAWSWDVASGRVETKPVRVAPRSRAGIAILPDGQVLFAGGNLTEFVPEYRCPRSTRPASPDADDDGCREEPAHWQAHATNSVELWDTRSGAVRTLEALPQRWWARYPLTLVLRNGNVVLTEYQPPNPRFGSQPAQALMWNGKSGKWADLPPLDGDAARALVELADGTLATLVGRLRPGATSWLATPSVQNRDARPVQLPSGRVAALSSQAPHFAIYDEPKGSWRLPTRMEAPPRWVARPTLLPLSNGKLMAIGQAEGGTKAGNASFIWDPASGDWTMAGELPIRTGQPSQAVELPSGRVVHVGAYRDRLVCETWHPSETDWQLCENFQISEDDGSSNSQSVRGTVLDTLDDGRALVLGGKDAFIFDEALKRWVKTQVEWSKESVPFGAPIRPGRPYAQVFDAQAQAWLDATAAATKYQERNSRGSPPAMLWDRERRQWDYVFQQGPNEMGTGAVRLPDGCAFSWQKTPWRVFNPATGQVTRHPDPGIGITSTDGSMAVLADGTAVFVDARYGAASEMIFQTRRLGCGGFEAPTDDVVLMPPVLYEERPEVAPAAIAAPAPSWRETVEDFASKYRWIALALLGPLALYLVARRALPPLQRALVDFVSARTGASASAQVGSRGFRWILRLILYGVAIVIALPLVANIAFFKALERADEGCDMVPTACLDAKTGILKPVSSLGREPRTQIPCRYVGTWSSIRPKKVYRIDLDAGGRYRMSDNTMGTGNTGAYQGYWAVQGNHMLWRADKGIGMPIDINEIVGESETSFSLIEKDGSSTRFELIHPGEAQGCSP